MLQAERAVKTQLSPHPAASPGARGGGRGAGLSARRAQAFRGQEVLPGRRAPAATVGAAELRVLTGGPAQPARPGAGPIPGRQPGRPDGHGWDPARCFSRQRAASGRHWGLLQAGPRASGGLRTSLGAQRPAPLPLRLGPCTVPPSCRDRAARPLSSGQASGVGVSAAGPAQAGLLVTHQIKGPSI